MAALFRRVRAYFLFIFLRQQGHAEEINGTITFGMSWDGSEDVVKHEIWADTGEGAENISNILFPGGSWNLTHVQTKVRIKRKAPEGKDYVRHGPACLQRQLDMLVDDTPRDRKLRLGKSVHVALMVSEKEEVQMACHYCDQEEGGNRTKKYKKRKDKTRMSMLWYQLSRKMTKGRKEYFKVDEVHLDLHDNDKRNRVFVTDTHTLVIRKVTEKDGGTYFCRDMTKPDPYFKEKLTPAEIAIMFKADDKLRFMYHVDVITAKGDKWKTKMVKTDSNFTSKLPLATPDVKVSDYNIEIFTSWERMVLQEVTRGSGRHSNLRGKAIRPHNQTAIGTISIGTLRWLLQEWSRCSSCDQPGTRRRLGVCMVRKIDKEKKSTPWYVNMMLNIYTRGVLCRSTVFTKHKMLSLKVLRPVDEIEEGVCNVTCSNYTMSIKDMVITESGKVKIKVFVLKEGESVALACPGAPADMPVAWINRTRVLIRPYLKSQSDGRLRIDDNNTFHISRLELTDAGHYLCVVGGKIAGRVMLGVERIPPKAIVWRYAYYLLWSYPIDFAIFLLFLYVRHVQRKKVLNYDMLPELSDDSTASGSSASDINVNRDVNASARRVMFPSSVTMLVETAQPSPSVRQISARSSSIVG